VFILVAGLASLVVSPVESEVDRQDLFDQLYAVSFRVRAIMPQSEAPSQ